MKSEYPVVSVVIPVKRSQQTIRQTVDSLLAQDYPGDVEILVIGDREDPSWAPIIDLIHDRQVVAIEVDVEGPGRDSNAKRNFGLAHARGDIMALTDGDIVLPRNWISGGVAFVEEGWNYISGAVRSMDDGFWGAFVDSSQLGSKIPDISEDYFLDSEFFGRGTRKPPITGNTFVTRTVLEDVGNLDINFVTSYEDYEWARRVVDGGYKILRTGSLVAKHYHRKGFKGLVREHHRSGCGCGDYVRKHPHCQFGQQRLRQLRLVYLMVVLVIAAMVSTVLSPVAPAAMVAGALLLMCFSSWKTKSLIGAVYPFIALLFGLAFCVGLTRRFWFAKPQPETRVVESNVLTAMPASLQKEG
jgi:cellulose synthase/poly-beta-1,6-N-acetylglucosamine synthase-like glycosyltransferase